MGNLNCFYEVLCNSEWLYFRFYLNSGRLLAYCVFQVQNIESTCMFFMKHMRLQLEIKHYTDIFADLLYTPKLYQFYVGETKNAG